MFTFSFEQGYKDIMENCMGNAKVLREGIENTGQFEIVSKESGVPLVAFALKDSSKYTVFDISENLRRFGWIVPAYTMPPDAERVAVLRVVIREDFSRSLAERLVADIQKVLHELEDHANKIAKIVNVSVQEKPAGTMVKKSVQEMEKDITKYWRKLVDRKKTSGVC